MRSLPLFLLSGCCALVCALVVAAQGPVSTNFCLLQRAGSVGTSFGAAVTSTSYRLTTCSVGGIADDVIGGTNWTAHPGYITPWDAAATNPFAIVQSERETNRHWLYWAPATNADRYRVEALSVLPGSGLAQTGGVFYACSWNGVVTGDVRFLRVIAIDEP